MRPGCRQTAPVNDTTVARHVVSGKTTVMRKEVGIVVNVDVSPTEAMTAAQEIPNAVNDRMRYTNKPIMSIFCDSILMVDIAVRFDWSLLVSTEGMLLSSIGVNKMRTSLTSVVSNVVVFSLDDIVSTLK